MRAQAAQQGYGPVRGPTQMSTGCTFLTSPAYRPPLGLPMPPAPACPASISPAFVPPHLTVSPSGASGPNCPPPHLLVPPVAPADSAPAPSLPSTCPSQSSGPTGCSATLVKSSPACVPHASVLNGSQRHTWYQSGMSSSASGGAQRSPGADNDATANQTPSQPGLSSVHVRPPLPPPVHPPAASLASGPALSGADVTGDDEDPAPQEPNQDQAANATGAPSAAPDSSTEPAWMLREDK